MFESSIATFISRRRSKLLLLHLLLLLCLPHLLLHIRLLSLLGLCLSRSSLVNCRFLCCCLLTTLTPPLSRAKLSTRELLCKGLLCLMHLCHGSEISKVL